MTHFSRKGFVTVKTPRMTVGVKKQEILKKMPGLRSPGIGKKQQTN